MSGGSKNRLAVRRGTEFEAVAEGDKAIAALEKVLTSQSRSNAKQQQPDTTESLTVQICGWFRSSATGRYASLYLWSLTLVALCLWALVSKG